MTDYFEIDFLAVESAKSGDAIALRYEKDGVSAIHVVDGGYQQSGEALVAYIKKNYGNPTYINHVIVTHSDGDHAGGLREVLNSFDVGELWMLRPWLYASELLPSFPTYNSAERLAARLRTIYNNLAELEDIANEKGIAIREPFRGASIGAFTVMSPSITRYFELVIKSEKTPESTIEHQPAISALLEGAAKMAAKLRNLVRVVWGVETFSTEETSAENEMSVVQYAHMCDERILLTGDAGRLALSDTIAFAPSIGLFLPGITRFQVPHHGSRRNVSSAILDALLGQILPGNNTIEGFYAFISSAKADVHHPRKVVVRAMIHRGAKVYTTEGGCVRTGKNAPSRSGWTALEHVPYPEEQEEA